MNRRSVLALAAVLIGAFLAAGASGAPAGPSLVAIKAGRVVDPAAGTLSPSVTILVEGRTIKAMGPVAIPKDARVVDLSGLTVLPGLFDCHTHVCEMISGAESFSLNARGHLLFETTLDRALQGVAGLRSFLEAGFTTVRDLGNAGDFADIALRKALRRGTITGPTLLVSGKIIAPFGGQNQVTYQDPDVARRDYFYADTRDEMRKAVRENLHYGADWIKIVIDDQRYAYTAEDVAFIVAEAANGGARVAAHCLTERGARAAVEGGVASIEHGFEMSDGLLKAAKDKGVWLCGTELSKEAWAVYKFDRFYPMEIDRLKRAHAIGLPMAFGSDLIIEVPGYTRGQASLLTVNSWIEAGIPAPDTLRALTSDAAKMMAMPRRGVLKEGNAADIIAIPGNPLEDIRALRDVRFVMKDGVVVKGAERRP